MLEAVVCNDQSDPNVAIACAQQMVQEGVVAVAGSLSTQAESFMPVLEQAEIPYLGNQGSSGQLEFQSADSYPVVGGAVGAQGGAGRYLADQGAKHVVILRVTAPAADLSVNAMQKGAEAGGATVDVVKVADDATDYSAVLASVMELHPDGIGLAIQRPSVPQAIAGLHGLGYTGPIATALSYLDPKTIESMGADGVGLVGVGDVLPVSNTDNPFIKDFIAALKDEAPETAPDPASLKAYMGVKMVAGALNGMESFTAADLKKHLDNFDGQIDFGDVVPKWTGVPNPPRYDDFPRLAELRSFPQKITESGTLVSAGDSFDPFATA
jgi:ABC-type branched-subunit amino acid transport system substrate-binding protein